MKTNLEGIGKKDWQKVEARVLGQILAAQNIDFTLPDIIHIASFFAETLNTIPGIASCRVCLADVTVQRGEMYSEICEGCQASRKRAAGQDEISPFLPDFDFKCGLGEQPGMHLNAVASLHHRFGFFTFQVSDLDVFSVYRPFIGNLANYVALSLENRLQRDLLQKSQVELERKVDERTQDLVAINKHLQDEIETRRQAENALKESEKQIRQLVDASPVAMVVSSGIDEHMEMINNKFIELFGYTIEDMPDVAHWWPIAYPDEKYREEIKTQWQTKVEQPIKDKGQIEPIEAMVTCKDGSHRYIEFRFSSIGQKKLITFVDLTERKRVEQALRESETEFRAVFESSVDAIGVSKVGIHTFVNPAYLALFGYANNTELNGKPILDLIAPSHREQILENVRRRASGQVAPIAYETRGLRKDGSEFDMDVHTSTYELSDEIYSIAILRDITERKRAQEKLRASETRFRIFVDHAADAFFLHDERGNILDVNQQACKSLGYSREELIRMSPLDFDAGTDRDRPVTDQVESRLDVGETVAFETLHRRKDNSLFPVDVRARSFWQGERRFSVSSARDISERKQAEQALRESEERLRQIASSLREVIWLRDAQTRQVLYVNPAFEELTGRTCESFYENRDIVIDTIHPDDKEEVIEALEQRFEGVPFDKEHRIVHSDGSVRWVSSRIFPVRNDVGDVYRWASIMEDITERKQMEDALAAREREFRTLAENSPDNIARYDANCLTIYVNPTLERTLGSPASEMLGTSPEEVALIDEARHYQEKIAEVIKTGKDYEMDIVLPDKGEGVRYHNVRFVAERGADGTITGVQTIGRDITERKQHEREREAIITVSTAMRQARTRTEILNVILDQLVDLFDADGAVLVLPDPKTEGCINEMGRGIVGERMVGLNIPPGKGVCDWAITNKKTYLNNHADDDPLFYRSDLLGDSHCVVAAPLAAQELIIGALWVARQVDFVGQDLRLLTAIVDIAANAVHRVTLHEQTEQQLHRLIALHQIDLAISTNFDLNITLNVILGSVKDELEVDAASILLLNPITHALDYTAGIGFRTHNIEGSRVRLGNGCAGRAAQEQRTVSSLELGQARETLSRFLFLSGEDFTSHYATPLVVKGQVKGVLEIFHRAAIEPEHTWLGYFETLATQAAIAIDNASLFENLQRFNMELTLAYDATIEGWSRALDLRDRETEGHTQRVTEMALELAKKMGMSDAEKMDLRRGALLHDIGKMGIPDAILLKPSPLSDEEWKIMRQHPLYAYQMLAPISYLKRALEIPYCHHEKWDGSGYPRGLKGEEIPLSARVFSVVDVFDALISDRPYSKPWPREQAYRYIREQVSKHFDPQIVKIFLETK